jgi:hypothetical protein
MKTNKDAFGMYLLDVQLLFAGYQITQDELTEMYSATKYFNPDFYHNTFSISEENWEKWKKFAIKETQKVLKLNYKRAESAVAYLDLGYGLTMK